MEKAEREAATQRVRPEESGKNAFSREATERMVGNASGQRTENFLRLILHVKKWLELIPQENTRRCPRKVIAIFGTSW